MGFLSSLFSSQESRISEAIERSYEVKGFNKTDIAWSDAVKFATDHDAEVVNDEGLFNLYIDSEEVIVRFLRNPKNGKTVIIVENAEDYREQVAAMYSDDYDPSQYPSYKLEF